jgi:hypothetical protein
MGAAKVYLFKKVSVPAKVPRFVSPTKGWKESRRMRLPEKAELKSEQI